MIKLNLSRDQVTNTRAYNYYQARSQPQVKGGSFREAPENFAN